MIVAEENKAPDFGFFAIREKATPPDALPPVAPSDSSDPSESLRLPSTGELLVATPAPTAKELELLLALLELIKGLERFEGVPPPLRRQVEQNGRNSPFFIEVSREELS